MITEKCSFIFLPPIPFVSSSIYVSCKQSKNKSPIFTPFVLFPSCQDLFRVLNDQQVDQRPALRMDGHAAIARRVLLVSVLMLIVEESFETVVVINSMRSAFFRCMVRSRRAHRRNQCETGRGTNVDG